MSSLDRRRLKHRLSGLIMVFLVLVVLALAWSQSPLRNWLDIDLIVLKLQQSAQTYGVLVAISGFALAVSLAVPLTFLTLVTLVAFGPWLGFACSMGGALIGAALSYGLGRILGREVVQRLAGQRINMLSQRLASRGLLAVILVRLVPVAPFAIVNLVAGATHIRLRDMLLGTCLGMIPGTLVIAVFTSQIIAAIKHPTTTSLLMLMITVTLIIAGLTGFRFWLRRTQVTE